MESKLRIRKSQRMHYKRVSIPFARYFVTMVVEGRNAVLCNAEIALRLIDQLEKQSSEGDLELHCLSLMPDHLHLVFRLNDRLKLGQVIAKFKAKTNDIVSWQGDFFDHRIRDDESEDEYGFYVFMNSYKAGLIGLDERWSWWRRWRVSPYKCETLLDGGKTVPAKWLDLVDELDVSVGLDLGPDRVG